MRFLCLCLSIFLFFGSLPLHTTAEADNDVVVLTSENIDEHLSSGDWMIKFYAPWCGHCKRLAPTWEKLATELKGKVNVGKVDASIYRALGARYDVKGFPTLFHISDGKVRRYSGSRGLTQMQDFALGGYENTEPLGFLESPFGPAGTAKLWLTKLGLLFVDLHQYLVKEYKLSEGIAAGAIVGACIVALITILIVVVSWCVPVDSPVARPHQD